MNRTKVVMCVGAQIGIVVTMPISGVLCHYVNWDSVFYVFGQSLHRQNNYIVVIIIIVIIIIIGMNIHAGARLSRIRSD